jgi:hypothetical protein
VRWRLVRLAQVSERAPPYGRLRLRRRTTKRDFCAARSLPIPTVMAKKKTKKPKAPRVYRDSTTGRFVTKRYAKKNPTTTLKERHRIDARSTQPVHSEEARTA